MCERAFPDRPNQQIAEVRILNSRQHEVTSFELWWFTPDGITDHEDLIARRYVSTVSWWRPDDRGKAQRETTVTRWLGETGFPVPKVYTREFGAYGDVVLFARLPNDDPIGRSSRPLSETIVPYIEPFAQRLAELHSLSPPDEVRRVLPWVTLPGAVANLFAVASQLHIPELTEAIDGLMSRAYDVQETEPVVIHGDYHFLNALMKDGQITGIIDWEYCALADPRWDVANVYSQLVDFGAPQAANQFLQMYMAQTDTQFGGPPLYNVVAPLQQWTISEWIVQQTSDGDEPGFGMAAELITLRDVHKRRALRALQMLD
ncbi:MAG: phosphotransferase family protein [Anaerolineae bacterium]